MQPMSNPPATIVVLDEKEPLLPLNSQPAVTSNCRLRTKAWIKEHIPRAFVYGLFFYIFFSLLNKPYKQWKPEDEKRIATVNNVFDLETFDNVLDYNENQLNSAIVIKCNGKPPISYEGLSKFEFDTETFPHLTIEQKTHYHRSNYREVIYGNTIVVVDETISKASVKFDVNFDDKDLQDLFYIEQTDDEEQGAYSLTIRLDETYDQSSCISIDTKVRVPNAAALKTLSISLSNNGVSLKKGLVFENLAVSVANGYVEFEKGISSGITAFAVANGHVNGIIDTLTNKLTSSIANGHNEISIKQIELDDGESIDIKAAAANGHSSLQLPSSFNSQFRLESVLGKRTVESSHPEDIHRRSGKWGITAGYYGNDKNAKNSVTLKSSNGRLKLSYI